MGHSHGEEASLHVTAMFPGSAMILDLVIRFVNFSRLEGQVAIQPALIEG